MIANKIYQGLISIMVYVNNVNTLVKIVIMPQVVKTVDMIHN